MAFLAPNDILVLEKNTGKVDRIVNGRLLPNPVLDVAVANYIERGLLGIAVAPTPFPQMEKDMFIYIIHKLAVTPQMEMNSSVLLLQKEIWYIDMNGLTINLSIQNY